ncbi:MAG: asparaginase domain-containing protein [Planctomycetaceae bacterium]|nr:asparaginase domain-containing protein [Planctomycetaceae bacterium]
MQIRIYSCGGTIDKVYFDARSDFTVGEPQIKIVFDDAIVAFDYDIESLMRKDSLEMTDEDRQLVRERVAADPARHILITHGTDTMANTAEALMGIPDKVIVLTGSMIPARFRVTDAVFNIGCAVGVLQSKPPGVYLAMNGRAFDAGNVRKNRAEQRFEPLASE